MINLKQLSRFLSAFLLAILLITAPLAQLVAAQQGAQATATAAAVQNYAESLAAIEKSIDAKRQELGIPGLSLAIVKDDKIIYMKGLGFKDFERKLPVTPDTLFAIGSASKAFTGMAAVISADEGRLSLDDSPKKFLPYFTLHDADAAVSTRVVQVSQPSRIWRRLAVWMGRHRAVLRGGGRDAASLWSALVSVGSPTIAVSPSSARIERCGHRPRHGLRTHGHPMVRCSHRNPFVTSRSGATPMVPMNGVMGQVSRSLKWSVPSRVVPLGPGICISSGRPPTITVLEKAKMPGKATLR
mgnify:CR=1 FL=1